MTDAFSLLAHQSCINKNGANDSCVTCGKNFLLLTQKLNCSCCGKHCCIDCVRTGCAIATGGSPSKVCIDCFLMLQSNQRGVVVARERDSPQKVLGDISPAFVFPQTDSDFTHRQTVDNVNTKALTSCEANKEQHAFDVDILLVPRHCGHSDDLLSLSDFSQRRKSDVLPIRQLTQGTPDTTHSGKCDGSFAPAALSDGESITVRQDKKQEQESPRAQDEEENENALVLEEDELKSQLKTSRHQIYTMEKELRCALRRARESEEKAWQLQQFLLMYEEGRKQRDVHNKKMSPVYADCNVIQVATRSFSQSIVLATKSEVIVPKICPSLNRWVNIRNWGFDAFEIASRVPSVLQAVAAEVALQWDLFTSEEEAQKWARLVAAVENNYRPNPYHNATHAADVLQGTFALVTAAEPLMQYATPLELKAVALAAMAHDVRHPGRTNAFLAAVHDAVCFQFGGYGTLEKLHAATVFELLSVPELDITLSMDNASFLTFKNIVTRIIEHTDMASHAASMTRWGAKVAAGGFDFTRAEERVEAFAFFVHASDIGASSRGVSIAKKWLVVLDEFAEQAEEERRRGLPVTLGFDRPLSVGASQIPFLDFFVIPIFDLLHQLFPCIEEPLRNLCVLREHYAAEAGVKTPFPRSVDYMRHEAKSRRPEIAPEEFCCCEEGYQHCLNDLKAFNGMLKKKFADLKVKEKFVGKQLRFILREEGRLRTYLSKIEEIMHKCRGVMHGLDLSLCSSADDFSGSDDNNNNNDDDDEVANFLHFGGALDVAREAEKDYGQDGFEHEEDFVGGHSDNVNYEKQLVAYSKKLLDVAKKVNEKRKNIGKPKEQWASRVFLAESAPRKRRAVTPDHGHFVLTPRETEERLTRKYNEMDELLLSVRSMRRECGDIHSSEVRQQALFATLAEREAAITEAVELSCQRRRRAGQDRVLQSATPIGRLENVIYDLTTAVTLLTK